MRPSHIIMNPRIEENRQKATSWLDTNLDKDKWRAEGKFNTDFVFTDKEDEFKFKLALGELTFVATRTEGVAFRT